MNFATLRFARVLVVLGVSCLPCISASSGADGEPEWRTQVQDEVSQRRLDAALRIVEQHLYENPDDLEAEGWHARILSWKGDWDQAELEYKHVLRYAPDDLDILAGLADVLVWKDSLPAALEIVNRALKLSPGNLQLLLRRAKILQSLGRGEESLRTYKEVLTRDPGNGEAKKGLGTAHSDAKHELRMGEDVDFLSYAPNGQVQTLSLGSRWNERWSTGIETSAWQRFGERAYKLSASTGFRMSHQDSLAVAGAIADDHKVIPHAEASFEYAHGFRLNNRVLHGYEVSYQHGWLWYRDAHVLTVGATQLFYFPRGWIWTLSVRGARTGFLSPPVEWAPSGLTRLQLPLGSRLTGQTFFAVGTENFAEVDEVGHFSAHTFGGGLRYRFAPNQDISGYAAYQNRFVNESQTSFGLSYGIRF